jgi:hypothetical protein
MVARVGALVDGKWWRRNPETVGSEAHRSAVAAKADALINLKCHNHQLSTQGMEI